MKVDGIKLNYCTASKNVQQKKNPNFKARLFTTGELATGFKAMGGDLNWYIMNMKGLAARLKYLPDKPIMVALSEDASNALKRGRIPSEPAAEVFIGRPISGNYNTVESNKVAINLNSRYLPDDIYEAAENLIG